MQTLSYPSPHSVRVALGKKAVENVVLFDNLDEAAEALDRAERPDTYDLMRGLSAPCRAGDLTLAAASDAFLSSFETDNIETVGFHWRDDVCGSFANVPAYISGVPTCMRNRRKAQNAASPIAVVFDAFPSMSVSGDAMAKVGAAVTAFVRILATRRPVELWVGGSLDNQKNFGSSWVLTRVETAPLDLSRAAYAICHEKFGRYSSSQLIRANIQGSGGAWPYCSQNLTRRYMADALRPALAHVEQILAIPAIHTGDTLQRDPRAWLTDMLAKHVATDLEN